MFGNIENLASADSYLAISDQIAEKIDEGYPDRIVYRIDNNRKGQDVLLRK